MCSARGIAASFTILALISADLAPGFAFGQVVDLDPPSEPVISSIAGDNYINASEASAVHVVGTADAGTTIDVSLSDGTDAATGSGLATGLGAFDITIDVSGLDDGTITPAATSTDDDAGLESTPATTPTATKDTVASSLSITSGPAEGSATSSPSITFGFTAELGATLTCLFDGASSAACDSSTAHASSSMADGSHGFSVAAADAAGNAATSSRTFSVDATTPVLSEVTAVSTPSEDTTPGYTFSTSEAGTILYGGSCTSPTTAASSGSNAITFDALATGTFTDCTIRITDTLGNQSDLLSVSSFTISSPPEPEPAPAPASGGGGGGNGPIVGSFSTILSAPSISPPAPVSAPAPAPSVPVVSPAEGGASEGGNISVTLESANAAIGTLAVAGGAVTGTETGRTKKTTARASEPVSAPVSDLISALDTEPAPVVQSAPHLDDAQMVAAAAEVDLESRGLLRFGWIALIIFTILFDIAILWQWMRYRRYRTEGYEYATR